jgi:DNA-binding IclR family transcriptional regulator
VRRVAGSTDPDRIDDAEERVGSASLAPAVTRAVAILDALAQNPSRPTSLSELSRLVGAPKSSVANVCGALVDAGLVRRWESGFALGRRLAELGGVYLASVDVVTEFYQGVRGLAVASEETAQLAVLDGIDVTYLARHDGKQPIRLASEIGRRLPATCTALGKAALAALPVDDLAARLQGVAQLPQLTPRSHRTVAALLDDLDDVRRRGYAVDDEETAEGIMCFGVAIRSRAPTGERYAISATMLKARAESPRREALVADLQRLARLLANPLIVDQRDGQRDGRIDD